MEDRVLSAFLNNGLTPKAAARRALGISAMSQWRWEQKGILPKPVHISGRGYYPTDQWNEALSQLRNRGAQ